MQKTKVIAKINMVKCEMIDSAFYPQFEELIRLIARSIASRFLADF